MSYNELFENLMLEAGQKFTFDYIGKFKEANNKERLAMLDKISLNDLPNLQTALNNNSAGDEAKWVGIQFRIRAREANDAKNTDK